jgi:uncharacterized protein (DUF1778 family)
MEQTQERQSEFIHVRIAPLARAVIEKVCESRSMTLSEFIRSATLGKALAIVNGKDNDTK